MQKTYIDRIVQLLGKDKFKVVNPVYLSVKEVNKVTKLIVWVFNLSEHQPLFLAFAKHIIHLWVKSGDRFIVNYLKEAHLAIMKVIAGDSYNININGTRVQIDKHTRLPAFIPIDLRKLMLSNPIAMRAVLSMTSYYRIISCNGEVDTGSIVAPFNGLSDSVPIHEIEGALKELPRLYLRGKPSLLCLLTAGPNHERSVLGLVWDAYSLYYETNLYKAFTVLSAYHSVDMHKVLRRYAICMTPIIFLLRLLGWNKILCTGRLSVKTEPAGKRRIFAITDGWTQSILNPLHKGIFGILRRLPMDGTFNQDAPLRLLVERLGDRPMWSFDLKSATDRLPVKLQEDILSLLVSPEYADAWKNLLTNRSWYLKGKPLTYAVGQPMGALSSWASLALTHHVVVRVAARRCGIAQFSDYCVLGDDIVIADEAVAKSYLNIMIGLGVEISTHKTLVSNNGTCEFAKRLINNRFEYTPIGASLILLASRHWSYFPNLFIDLHNKGVHFSADLLAHRFSIDPIPLFKESHHLKILTALVGPGGFFSKTWSSIQCMDDWTRSNIKPSIPTSGWMLAVEMNESSKLQRHLIDLRIMISSYSFVNYKIISFTNCYRKVPLKFKILQDIILYVFYIPGTFIMICDKILITGGLLNKPIGLSLYESFNGFVAMISPGPYLLYNRLIQAELTAGKEGNKYKTGFYSPDLSVSLESITFMIQNSYEPLSIVMDQRQSSIVKSINYFSGSVIQHAMFMDKVLSPGSPLVPVVIEDVITNQSSMSGLTQNS